MTDTGKEKETEGDGSGADSDVVWPQIKALIMQITVMSLSPSFFCSLAPFNLSQLPSLSTF